VGEPALVDRGLVLDQVRLDPRRAGGLDEAWLEGVETVGVTSGASAPERLVRDVCDWFRARGVADVAEFSSAFEDVVFRLPVELRRAQRSAA
jgi:4-hydroxy-3-methylbut-2-enyl diphosphate reductase